MFLVEPVHAVKVHDEDGDLSAGVRSFSKGVLKLAGKCTVSSKPRERVNIKFRQREGVHTHHPIMPEGVISRVPHSCRRGMPDIHLATASPSVPDDASTATLLVEHHGALSVQQHTVLEVPGESTGQHRPFDVAAEGH